MTYSDNQISNLNVDDTIYETKLTKKFANRKNYQPPDPKKLTAFIPGTIKEIFVHEGQTVKRGDPLLNLEAMKMVNLLKSGIDGRVAKIYAEKNQIVMKNKLLLEFE